MSAMHCFECGGDCLPYYCEKYRVAGVRSSPNTTLTFIIPKSWWISANDRSHWAAKMRATRELRQLGRRTANVTGHGPFGTTHVAAFIGYLTGGRADPSNAAPTIKALIDGLVDADLLVDDDHTHVIGPTYLRDPKSPTPGAYTVRLVLTPQEVPWP